MFHPIYLEIFSLSVEQILKFATSQKSLSHYTQLGLQLFLSPLWSTVFLRIASLTKNIYRYPITNQQNIKISFSSLENSSLFLYMGLNVKMRQKKSIKDWSRAESYLYHVLKTIIQLYELQQEWPRYSSSRELLSSGITLIS